MIEIKYLTRGERNNNPTNIKRSCVTWLGEAPKETDPIFCQFISGIYGIRAAFVNLRTHINRLGKQASVAALVHIWAPPTENDTAAYLKNVTTAARLNSDYVMTFDDARLVDLMVGIITAENGRCIYANNLIEKAWECATKQTLPEVRGTLL